MSKEPVPLEHRSFAKQQRFAMTRAERLVWHELRAKRFRATKFRRQAPIGKYVADFLCLPARLIIELDGEPHLDAQQQKRDEVRDQWLSKQGFRVVRFTNDEVLGNPSRVMKPISDALEAPSLGSRLRRESALSRKGRE
jgi:very-short-patch-repair endonuclease